MSYIKEFDPQVIQYLQALWRKYEETGDIYWCHVGSFRARLYEWEHSTGTKPEAGTRMTKPTKDKPKWDAERGEWK